MLHDAMDDRIEEAAPQRPAASCPAAMGRPRRTGPWRSDLYRLCDRKRIHVPSADPWFRVVIDESSTFRSVGKRLEFNVSFHENH